MEMEDLFLRLPVEITTEILSELDTDSVVECKRVSKTWQSLIDDRSFIDLHTNRLISSKQNHAVAVAAAAADDDDDTTGGVVLDFVWKHAFEDELRFGDYEDDQRVFCLTKTTEFYAHWKDWELLGSCNGLICLSKPLSPHADDVYVCNPFTREYLNLPRDDDHNEQPYVTIGFGHDAFTNEYKVVRLYEPTTPEYPRQMKVYTLGNGKWRRSKKGNENEIIPSFPWLMQDIKKAGLFSNGALYWSIRDLNIISFDLVDEEFKIIPLPNNWSRRIWSEFGVLGGYFFVYERVKYLKCTNVWVLDKGTHTWIKNVIPWDDRMNYTHTPFAFLSNGRILLWGTGPVIAYHPKTRRLDRLRRRFDLVWRPVIPYMKSIVSLNKLGEKDTRYASKDGSICNRSRDTSHILFRRFFQ